MPAQAVVVRDGDCLGLSARHVGIKAREGHARGRGGRLLNPGTHSTPQPLSA